MKGGNSGERRSKVRNFGRRRNDSDVVANFIDRFSKEKSSTSGVAIFDGLRQWSVAFVAQHSENESPFPPGSSFVFLWLLLFLLRILNKLAQKAGRPKSGKKRPGPNWTEGSEGQSLKYKCQDRPSWVQLMPLLRASPQLPAPSFLPLTF